MDFFFDKTNFEIQKVENFLKIKAFKTSTDYVLYKLSSFIEVSCFEEKLSFTVKNKKKASVLKTQLSEIKNILQGLQTPFLKKLIFKYHHFPVEIQVQQNEVILKNFFGGKKDRVFSFSKNVSITKLEENLLCFSCWNKTYLNSVCSNLIKQTSYLEKDVRIFQDGFYEYEEI